MVICHLDLAVVVGTLQSLVPSTPNAIGASFLHHVYQNIHNETLDNFDDIHVDSALSPGAPAGYQANSAITGKTSTATNWLRLVRTIFCAPHITTLSPHKLS
jgi:hypothetical protein